jgi:hypothetical protein
MKRILAGSVCVAVLAGCWSAQPPAIKELLVGRYLYKSQDPEGKQTDHEWERQILGADGKYLLVQGGPTKPRSEVVGDWTITSEGAREAEVLLDHAGYPIEITGSEVRLLIDLDLGIWYTKAR